MKTRIKLLFLSVFFALLCCISLSSYADDPEPPVLPGEHGAAGDVSGAPIDNGMIILLAMGAGYAAYRLYSARKEKAKKLVN